MQRRAFLVAALVAAALVSPGSSLAATSCSVRSATTGAAYADIQDAVSEAGARDTLTLSGVCTGAIEITVPLRLVGVAATGTPVATLQGDASGPVIRVADDTRLVVRDLAVTNGVGGIWSRFNGAGTTVVLKGSTIVTSDPSAPGRGVRADTVRLGGRAIVAGNVAAGDGGGVLATDVFLTGTAVVRDNAASGWGGGIKAVNVVMSGRAAVIGNTAESGGGISAAHVTLRDAAVVRDNAAEWTGRERMLHPLHGGGIAAGYVVLSDDAAVTGNSVGWFFGTEGPEAGLGGGIWARAVVRLTGTSTVSENSATLGDGGGIFTYGRLVMRYDASVTGNDAADAGGILASQDPHSDPPTITLFDRASVVANRADYRPSIVSAGPVYVCSDDVVIDPEPPPIVPCG